MSWQIAFRSTAFAALCAAFIQVTLGGIVRVTGSGLGCPDWPLCHGEIIPPFEVDILIEYTHRLSATILGILVLATAVVVWVFYRSNKWLVIASMVGLVSLIIAAVLGGATVLTGLVWWVRLVHLAVAEMLVAAMVIVNVGAWQVSQTSSIQDAPLEKTRMSRLLLLAAIVGVFTLILSGSYMVGYGAGSSCATWPLCRGELLPQGTSYAIHMGHRLLSVIIGLLVVGTAIISSSHGKRRFKLDWPGRVLVAVFVMQVLVGAGIVWTGFAPLMKGMHLSLATLVWITLLFVATLMVMPGRVPSKIISLDHIGMSESQEPTT